MLKEGIERKQRGMECNGLGGLEIRENGNGERRNRMTAERV